MEVSSGMPSILCCVCGTRIESNPSNMCVNCLKSKVDISEGISKQVTIFFCRTCGKYQRSTGYVAVELESKEMLSLCLKKVKGLNRVKLVDAGFIYTEAHSRRIKLKLTIQKEVFNGAIMQQVFPVEFIVQTQQCPECQRSYTEHTWTAMVQVRQHVRHKRTLYFLEQTLIKHSVADNCMGVKEMPDGLDFYWGLKNQAVHLLQFLETVLPMRWNTSQKLISQDDHNNTFNYKFTYHAEIVPICKEDLVIIDKKLASSLGGVSPLLLCYRVSNLVHLVDPVTLKLVDISQAVYWRTPFRSIMQSKQLVEYVVLEVEKAEQGADQKDLNKQSNRFNDKFCLAEVICVRPPNYEHQIHCMTHMGNIINPGDSVLGYHVETANWNEDDELANMRGKMLPEVVLVKKSYAHVKNRAKKRQWQLKSLPKATDRPLKKSEQARDEEDMQHFLDQIEEDPVMRSHVNLYKKKRAPAADSASASAAAGADGIDDSSADEAPEVPVDELLEDMEGMNLAAEPDESGDDVDIDSLRLESLSPTG